MLIADAWIDYDLLDIGYGEKLERYGNIILRRPDPQVIWPRAKNELWDDVHAIYRRSSKGGGGWENLRKIPGKWTVSYKDLKFYIEPTGFKHTGIFPEQAVNWDFMINKIKNADQVWESGRLKKVKVLNLFGYTGGATVACAYAGAEVCHVDAAKAMVQRCSENIKLSGLTDRVVRYITDDVFKFVKRENRRGRKYDAIIMDPPSYGRGPDGEVWKIEDSLFDVILECQQLLSDDPLFFLINSYTAGFSPYVPANMLDLTVNKKYPGDVRCGEIGLMASSSRMILPCGVYGLWQKMP